MQVLILKEFAVDEEAAVVVEVQTKTPRLSRGALINRGIVPWRYADQIKELERGKVLAAESG